MGDAKTLTKGLDLLEKLAEHSAGMTAQELADCIAIHRSSVYRYLNAFLRRGYIQRDVADCYHLGNKLLELSSQMLRHMSLRETAHPVLVNLSAQTLQTTHLCVLDGLDVIYIDKVESQRTLPLASRIGSRAPAHCTAVGRMLLSTLPPEHAINLLRPAVLTQQTPMTITDPLKIVAILQLTAQRGYAVEVEETEIGVMCIAAPVWGQGGDCVAAISITGLKRDFTDDIMTETMIKAVKDSAAHISRDMGYVHTH